MNKWVRTAALLVVLICAGCSQPTIESTNTPTTTTAPPTTTHIEIPPAPTQATVTQQAYPYPYPTLDPGPYPPPVLTVTAEAYWSYWFTQTALPSPTWGPTLTITPSPTITPTAHPICDYGLDPLYAPIAVIKINLPDNPVINGFVFVSRWLGEGAQLELDRILGLQLTPGSPLNCDEAHQAAYDAKVQEIIETIRAGDLDMESEKNLRFLVRLARSIKIK